MKKTIIKIFLTIALLFSFGIVNADNEFTGNNKTIQLRGDSSDRNEPTGKLNLKDKPNGNGGNSKVYNNNRFLQDFKENGDKLINTNAGSGEKGLRNMILNIALSIKNIFLAITGIYFLIIVLRLLFTENAEEEFEKFKKGIRWITAGIILMQISYSYVTTIWNKEINGKLAGSLTHNIIEPIVKLLEAAASFFFIAIAIFAFFRIVSANGDEEKAKKGKMSVAYAIIGFIVIKVSNMLVTGVYSKTLCDAKNQVNCTAVEIKETAGVMFDVINWANGFVGIIVVIMIIYTGFKIIFSNGDDETLKKSKKSLLYIVIGILILTANYLILTFFLTDKIK